MSFTRMVEWEEIPSIWSRVRQMLGPALNEDKDFDLTFIYNALLKGKMHLWINYGENSLRTVLVVEYVVYGQSRVMSLRWLAGEDSEEWLTDVTMLENWARARGFDRVEVWGRKGWARLLRGFGYEERYRIVDKPLQEMQQ